MKKDKAINDTSKQVAQKLANVNTRGKNASGQTNGQNDKNKKNSSGHFTGAGEAPLMIK
ncbi:MAG: hypothetical protein H7Y20_13670 [Bryobacteraceae bacterium]|nr:hypothetical protein [Bryobacteraceae bacterium]